MFLKICPKCKKESFSASRSKNWICPYCNTNLTDLPAKPAGTLQKDKCQLKGTYKHYNKP